MQKKRWKRIVLWTLSLVVIGVVVLAVHIWWVMRPHVNASTRIMARIDVKRPIDRQDADRITAWLYGQKGVDHVLVNPKTEIVIFTFSPLKTNANAIVAQFRRDLPYPAERRMPSPGEMSSGCPVASTSFAYKVYNFMAHIL
jgi:hypothetical protein